VFGRLLGETIAHEIAERSFKDRTGMENTRQQSPVHASDYIDHGVGTLNVLLAANQALMNANFPVPPAFA